MDRIAIVLGYGFHQQDRTDAGNEDDHSVFAGLNYDIFDNTRIKASIARKVRFPSLRELYDQKSGNTELKAENTTHYQIGLLENLPEINTALEITGFSIDADDFIEKDEATERMANFESYRFRGVEVSLTGTIIENLILKMAYTYLDAENRSPDQPFDVLEYRPENKFSMEATYSFDTGMAVYASYLYIDERYHFDKNLEEKGVLDGYNLVSVKVSQKFLKDTLALYIGAKNLFDENYEESYSFVREGRRIYGGIEYHF